MQEVSALKVLELNSKVFKKIRNLYEDFRNKAVKDYKFELPPLYFEDFQQVVENGIMKGFVVFENDKAKGLLIYLEESHKAVEVNLIHIIDDENINERRKALIEALLTKLKDRTDWKVISYPLLGIQESFTKEIAPLGFKFAGQAIVRFLFNDFASSKIIESLTLPELPEGYEITSWKNEYFEQAYEVIFDAFKNQSDINFDPRFTSLDGSKEVVEKIASGMFGDFLAESTSVLLYNGHVEGICFTNLTTPFIANIPLIGVKSGHNNKGFGKYLLKNSVEILVNQVKANKLSLQEINATAETDNYPALRMYRKIGFREDFTYPHAYYKNKNLK